MTLPNFAFLCVIASMTAGANLLMRSSLLRVAPFVLSPAGILNLARQPMFIGAIALVGAAGILWFRALSVGDLSLVYPLFIGLSFLLTSTGAAFLLGERISPVRLGGSVVVLLGIFVTARS